MIRGEIGKTLTVEGVLQMFKSKSIVKDVSVSDGWVRLTNHLQAVWIIRIYLSMSSKTTNSLACGGSRSSSSSESCDGSDCDLHSF